MTDPTGCVFISYRRSPGRPAGDKEAALVRDALRHVGVPTWRDLDDLEHEPTEDAIIAAVNDPSLAGAVLLVSPEVETSTMVRNVEAIRLLRRHAQGDGFWVLPVLIGVDYHRADAILGSPGGFQNLERWNMHRTARETLTRKDAGTIGRLAIGLRLPAIRKSGGDRDLSIGVFARRPPGETFDLTHDFSARFNGRTVRAGAYSNFEKALVDSARCVLAETPTPRLVGRGMAPLPLGVLVGAVYSPRAGFNLRWVQPVEGHRADEWSLELQSTEFAVDVRRTLGEPASEELVLAIGVSADIEPAVAKCLRNQGLEPRAWLHCAPASGSYAPGRVLKAGEGVGFVHAVIREVRELREELGMARANLHLFLACPLAMAVLLGQKLNTFGRCHLYEHDPGKYPPYERVHTFEPSSVAYG